jgi:hypothetical protein
MATSTFLGIPRELRDTIYSYLHHEIRVHCPWRDSPRGSGLKNMCNFTLKNAPLPSVVRVNTQIRNEYIQSHPFRRLSATLDLEILEEQGINTAKEEGFVKAATSRLWSVTLRKMDTNYVFDFVVSAEWADFAAAAEIFLANAPKDTILHIAMENSGDPDEVDHMALSQFRDQYAARKKKEQFFRPPKSLAGRALSHGDEGYMLGFAAMLVGDFDGGPGTDKYSIGGEAHQFCHEVRTVGWYTFTSNEISDTFVDHTELAEWASKSLCTYPLQVLEKLGHEEREEVARYPFIIQGWTEI